MPTPEPLPASRLCTGCSADRFDFASTADFEPLDLVVGQERAMEAIALGIAVRRPGYNIFAFGPPGHGKSTMIERVLSTEASTRPVPDGWCYVYNFDDWHRPRALRLPAGRSSELAEAMRDVIDELLAALPAAFEADSYETQRKELSSSYEQRAQAVFETVSQEAASMGLAMVRGRSGFGFAPSAEGEVMTPEAFSELPEDEQEKLRAAMSAMEERMEGAMRDARAIEREARQALRELERDTAEAEIAVRLDELRASFADVPSVVEYLDAAQADMLERLELFRQGDEDEAADEKKARRDALADGIVTTRRLADPRLRRYEINVLVDREPDRGAPVEAETHPVLGVLVGSIEYEQRMGTMATDFTLIKAGALHRANGGFLVLDADELLRAPHSYDALKRALRNEEAKIEHPAAESSLATAVTLDPEPIPLDCKVVLIGDASLYYGLHAADPDFAELFKVPAEFATTMPRTLDGELLYARAVGTAAARDGVLPIDRQAMARVIEFSSRLAGDATKLSTRFRRITDLLNEADHYAQGRDAEEIGRQDIVDAIAARERRTDLARERMLESYERDIVLVDTVGEEVGQINALTVLARGEFAFGLPVRVTARTRVGGGDVVDIEREVRLGGPLHSKGVLILSGFLSGRYLPEEPLSMRASLTFEQMYSGVEGDSASCAELYALLSSLAEAPIRQSWAVTGSVNQAGDVQAIGGANEKIEGFFDVCRQDGLTGDQGVIIPEANVQHLMLREDVVQAVADGRFQIVPVTHVDEGIELLTGVPAGARGDDGSFPDGTVNRRVEDRLRAMAEARRAYLSR